MTLTLELPADLQTRLHSEAMRRGVDEAACARQLLEQSLPAPDPVPMQAAMNLLAQWRKEDEASDPKEMARRDREFEELMEAMNQNRRDSGGPDARMVWP